MAESAQAMVPVPEGLDLDAWIVAPPPVKEDHSMASGMNGAPKKRKGKGKGKEKAENGSARLVDVEETNDERTERLRVSEEHLSQVSRY